MAHCSELLVYRPGIQRLGLGLIPLNLQYKELSPYREAPNSSHHSLQPRKNVTSSNTIAFLLDELLMLLELPDTTQKAMGFTYTSFFTNDPNRQLPSPAEVRILSAMDNRKSPFTVPDLNLFVKFGPHVTPVEATSRINTPETPHFWVQ
ncbi:hypothetical protein BDV26DRAFT_269690 [Aspergillus bertholletiae]|uniref:Uncharacterized protein n=1 Tax=Aspergillus bertholletiae TaxID=1226010 RepID=A0A5N7AXJ7_9EURO|nr:hypothetical protein BDV26DRAFT_269690 [Aspergillus bertholletiae]